MNKKILAALACGALLTVVGCEETEVKEVKGDTKQTETAKEEKKEDKVYKVGETVEVNGLQITINSVAFAEPSQYIAPEKGKVLEVQFTAKNNSKEEKYFGAGEMKVADENGNQFKEYFGADDGFINENIAAGNQIQGKMYYDVAESAKYIATYKPMVTFDDKTVKFELTPQ